MTTITPLTNMAKMSTTIVYLFVVAVVAAPPPLWAGPSDEAANCSSYLVEAGDCLSFVENGSRLQKPDRDCCPELANLTNTHPVCICQLLFNSSQFDIAIDTNKASKLPSLCNVSTPPLSSCQANVDNGSSIVAGLPHSLQLLIGLLLLFISITLI